MKPHHMRERTDWMTMTGEEFREHLREEYNADQIERKHNERVNKNRNPLPILVNSRANYESILAQIFADLHAIKTALKIDV